MIYLCMFRVYSYYSIVKTLGHASMTSSRLDVSVSPLCPPPVLVQDKPHCTASFWDNRIFLIFPKALALIPSVYSDPTKQF